MTAATKRTLIGAGRKVVFAGLVLLIVWLALLGLRGAVPANTIAAMNAEMRMESQTGQTISANPRSWDWSRSLWSGKPVAGIVGERLGGTLGFIALTAVFSLLLALVFLLAGMLITRATGRPAWLAKTRSVLRLLLISAAVATPVFAWETLAVVYPAVWWGLPQSSAPVFIIAAFTAAALPAWLLVQYGQGELAKWPETPSLMSGALWRHLSISLAIRILKLAGGIIVIGVFVVLSTSLSGLGRQFVDAINRRDFPIIFGLVWASAVIVVLAKLAADLIEAGYSFSRRSAQSTLSKLPQAKGVALPKWLPVACLALVVVSVGVALAAPAIAPHHYNEMVINARLQAPSAQYILGTDNLGRDIFSRLIFGIRQDIFLSLIAAGVMVVIAGGWAILGAYVRRSDDWRGDTLEDLVMLPRDVLYALPWFILLLLLMSLVGMPSSGPVTFARYSLPVALAAGLVLLPRAVGMMQEAYRAPPEGRGWLQSVLLAMPVMLLFAVAGGILFIAGASYLGFGVAPPAPELGGMLSGPARRYMLQAPWMALWPPVVLIMLISVWVMAGNAWLERLGFRTRVLWSRVWE